MTEAYQHLIVGGGLSGLLLALKLSKTPQNGPAIALCEQAGRLGGRLTQTGLGLGVLDPKAHEIWERHFLSHISEEEHALMMKDLSTGRNLSSLLATSITQKPKCFFIKKEAISLDDLLTHHESATAWLNRKSRTILQEFLSLAAEQKLPEESEIQEALKEFQELKSLLDVCHGICPRLETYRQTIDLLSLWTHQKQPQTYGPQDLFLYPLEQVLQVIQKCLENRGVEIFLHANVRWLEQNTAKNGFLVQAGEHTHASQVVTLCLPLMESRRFLDRSAFTSSQLKFLGESEGLQSCVVLEIQPQEGFWQEPYQGLFSPQDRLIFPVEKAVGLMSPSNTILLYTMIPFEESLHAPSVRQSLNRLRKAAARLMREEEKSDLLEPRHARVQNCFEEKIVLVPMASVFLPYFFKKKQLAPKTACAKKGLFICGEHLFDMNDQHPWQALVRGVGDIFLT